MSFSNSQAGAEDVADVLGARFVLAVARKMRGAIGAGPMTNSATPIESVTGYSVTI